MCAEIEDQSIKKFLSHREVLSGSQTSLNPGYNLVDSSHHVTNALRIYNMQCVINMHLECFHRETTPKRVLEIADKIGLIGLNRYAG